MSEIDVLRRMNLDWAMRLSEVWDDAPWDAPGLHGTIREAFARKLGEMRQDARGASPLGWVVVGGGGAGKTHLLGSFRREAARQKAAFVLVDMTDVRDFWETVLQGYLDSLQQPFKGEAFQYQCLLQNIIQRLGPSKPVAEVVSILAERKSSDLAGDIQKVLTALNRTHPVETRKHHNVVRALICLNSHDYSVTGLGMAWLQGQSVEPADRQPFGFTASEEQPRKIVAGLSWLMGLSGPTVLAFDQLDPIVTQLHYRKLGEHSPEEQSIAESIIVQIGSGLGAMRDTVRNTLTVVSCVESTWDILSGTVLKTFVDRFEPAWRLDAVGSGEAALSVVRGRLARAFGESGYTPPYDSWPFLSRAFEALKIDSPREVLKKCENHRQKCLREGAVRELGDFAADTGEGTEDGSKEPKLLELDDRFAELARRADLAALRDEKEEERLVPRLQTALRCLLHERELPDGVGGIVDTEFTGRTATRPLHARLRLIFEKENGREEHFCVRALEQSHPRAYQTRLRAAMTTAGIDRSLKFRRLTVVRDRDIPGGAETQKLTEKFTGAGGQFFKPSDEDLRVLDAVHHLADENAPDFNDWLRSRQPLSKLPLIQAITPGTLLLNGGKGPAEPGRNGRNEPRRRRHAGRTA